MSTLTVYSSARKKVGEVDVPEAMTSLRINTGLIFSAVQAETTNRRQGTVATKTRGKVRGGGAKPYAQKGTGRARHGSSRSILFVGGGTAFGPQPRNFHDYLPKKQRRKALLHAVALKQQEENVLLVEGWECHEAKTKPMLERLKALEIDNGLLVLDAPNALLSKSVRNIPGIGVVEARCLSAADLVQYDKAVFTRDAWEQVQKRCEA
jgi:large subunit ribosomal protein L4